MKLTDEQLRAWQDSHADMLGAAYRHVSSGQICEVVAVGYLEPTLEQVVACRELPLGLVKVRLLREFLARFARQPDPEPSQEGQG